MESKGYHMKIPMPGHVVDPEALPSIFEDVQRIEELVKEHDVCF